MTESYTKNQCYGDIMNISCANCPYRRGYMCFEKEIKNGLVEGRYERMVIWMIEKRRI